MSFYKNNLLINSILLLEVILALFIFLYPILKPAPTGADAGIYLFEAKWIDIHNMAAKPHDATYHGFQSYTVPITSLNLVLWHQFTNLDLTFPIISLYQTFLFILIILTGFLIGKIYDKFTSLLVPIALLGSFSLIRLFIGSTMSNLLAFVYINIIYYCFHKYLITKNNKILILLFTFLITIYFTHNYLSAPIFIPTFLMYLVILFFIDKKIKLYILNEIKKIKISTRVFILTSLVVLVIFFITIYLPIFKEAMNAFWKSEIESKFIGAVHISQYRIYLGPFIFLMSIFGVIFYILKYRENILSYKLMPFLWIIVLFLISLAYKIGINFYYERIIFLGGVFIALFAAYFIGMFIKIYLHQSERIVMVIIMLFIVLVVIGGSQQVKALYDSSNTLTKDQIEVLNLLKNISQENEIIFSNINGASQIRLDVMVSDRDFKHPHTIVKFCDSVDVACLAFNQPRKPSSIKYFLDNNIKYFLLMTPSYEGNEKINVLSKKFESSEYYEKLFIADDVKLFKLK